MSRVMRVRGRQPMRRTGLWPIVTALGTILALGLFVAIAQQNVGEMRALRDQSVEVERTLEIQRVLDAIRIAESEADSSARAYVLTGRKVFLEQMRAQHGTASIRLMRLDELLRDNAAQQERLQRLRGAIEARRTRLDQVIVVRESGTLEAAVDEARASGSTSASNEVRDVIAQMEGEEARILSQRRSQADVLYRRAVGGRVGSSVVSAVLLLVVVAIAGLHARAKARRESALLASEQRALQAAAREQEARSEAEAANREKDQFLAVRSHELRTPLNAVLGWTQILQTTRADGVRLVKALAAIRRNAEAQQRLVEDLLDVSRIIAGKLAVERAPFDLRAAIGAAVDAVRPAAVSKDLDLQVRMDATPRTLGDAGRMQQVATNLLTNAVKFSEPGGTVVVRLEHLGDAALLEVRDGGAGIPADLLPHVFDRFRQGDSSTTRAHGGLGLGLAIARHIVEAHGGRVSVHSDGPGKGATFRVRIPYVAPPTAVVPATHAGASSGLSVQH